MPPKYLGPTGSQYTYSSSGQYQPYQPRIRFSPFMNTGQLSEQLVQIPGMAGYQFQTYQGSGQAPQSSYINDPTLAAGYTPPASSPTTGPPTGAVVPPSQYASGQVPGYLFARGWRSKRAPDGRTYWVPPGGGQQQQPVTPYGPTQYSPNQPQNPQAGNLPPHWAY